MKFLKIYDSETGPSVVYLGAENKLHTCKSVNAGKTSILASKIFDIISTPSHKSINLERNSISYKNLRFWRKVISEMDRAFPCKDYCPIVCNIHYDVTNYNICPEQLCAG